MIPEGSNGNGWVGFVYYIWMVVGFKAPPVFEYANRVQEHHPQHSLTRQEGEIGRGSSFPPSGALYASVLRSPMRYLAESGSALEVGKNQDTGKR